MVRPTVPVAVWKDKGLLSPDSDHGVERRRGGPVIALAWSSKNRDGGRVAFFVCVQGLEQMLPP